MSMNPAWYYSITSTWLLSTDRAVRSLRSAIRGQLRHVADKGGLVHDSTEIGQTRGKLEYLDTSSKGWEHTTREGACSSCLVNC